ncbi:hypothetical protein A2U01_0062100, partial [Trifolium medium]|nr:hypothetical protein [Trifolium medium]
NVNVGSVSESVQETVVITNAEAYVPDKNVILDTPEQAVTPEKEKSPYQVMTGNIFDDNTVVLSQSDESLKIVSEHVENNMSAEKNKDEVENVIYVDNLNSRESPAEKTHIPSIAKRLR